MQACVEWVLKIFRSQVIKKKRPVLPVFPDHLHVSYDYGKTYVRKRLKHPSRYLLVKSQPKKQQSNVWNLFKVNNKDNSHSAVFIFKVGLSLSKFFFICFNDSPSKMVTNAFYSILKAIFFLKIFVLAFWALRKNGLIRKIRLVLKFRSSQPS